jgi:hypothetical protein
MWFVDGPRTRVFPVCFTGVKSHLFLGPRNGHTRGVLSRSTSATLACRPLAWLISVFTLFLFPSRSLMAVLFFNPIELTFGEDRQSVGVAISLISIYLGLALLVFGTCSLVLTTMLLNWLAAQAIVPQWFVFDRVFDCHITWRHRSHISFVRQDRMQQFVSECPFTVFVVGGSQRSIPIGMICVP